MALNICYVSAYQLKDGDDKLKHHDNDVFRMKMNQSNNRKVTLLGMVLVALAFTTVGLRGEYPIRPVPIDSVDVRDGFWGAKLDTHATVTLPNNLEFIEKTGRLSIFDRAAGNKLAMPEPTGQVVDTDVYKILEGAAYLLKVRPEMVKLEDISEPVRRVIAAQQEDGFLCPRLILKDPRPTAAELPGEFGLWGMGYAPATPTRR